VKDKDIATASSFLKSELKGRYVLGDSKGMGGAGIAFLATTASTESVRVIKILRPSILGSPELKGIKDDFISEGHKLSLLHHPNLAIIYDFLHTAKYPFYIMDYIQGQDFASAAKHLAKKYPNGGWLNDVFEYARQLFHVLNYLHSNSPRPLLHLDIKPDNFLVNLKRKTGFLIDFGIARYSNKADIHDKDTAIRGTFPLWPSRYYKYLKHFTDENRTLFRINRRLVSPSLDLHLAVRTISISLSEAMHIDSAPSSWDARIAARYRLLTAICDVLDIDKNEGEPFHTAAEVCKWFDQGRIHDKRASNLFDYGLVKVPGSFIDVYGKKIRQVTDTRVFQRLRGIKQLGFTYLVYPGAKHDRFEHSLGVFNNAIRYLDQLSSQNVDFRFRSSLSEEQVLGTALAALLHDIGHSPFAHQMMIDGKYVDHELRTVNIITTDSELKRAIVRSLGKDVYEFSVSLMDFIYKADHGLPIERVTDPSYHVLRSILSSAIDVDKLDYISRDSTHAGVPYGSIVDRDRLISSLRVWYASPKEPTLVISDKGRACAEAMVFARYVLTSEVYWNHAVRAFSAMLSAAIRDVPSSDLNDTMCCADDEFLGWLRARKECVAFFMYFDVRRPYKRAFVLQRKGGGVETEESNEALFDRLQNALAAEGDYENVTEAVRRALEISSQVSRYDIVIDIPEGMTKVTGIHVLPEGHDKPDLISPIYNSIADHFDNVARKARIFISPEIMGERSLSDTNKRIRQVLCETYGISQ